MGFAHRLYSMQVVLADIVWFSIEFVAQLVFRRVPVPLSSLLAHTYRGYHKMREDSSLIPTSLDAEILSRPDLDSVALMTEPTLKAWGLPFDFLHTDEDVSKISSAFSRLQKTSSPFALLITEPMT